MTKQRKRKAAPGTAVFPVQDTGTKPRERLLAETSIKSALPNAFTALQYYQGSGFAEGPGELVPMMDCMQELIAESRDGSTRHSETVLIGQSVALNAIFTEMTRRAAMNMTEYPEAFERYMRLGLKAQAQCRTTLESLAEIKNPRSVAFVKQANIAGGHQQVNNGVATEMPPAREENTSSQNGLLEERDGAWLDIGPAQAAGRGNPSMETVGAIDGSAHQERQGRGKPKRVEGRS